MNRSVHRAPRFRPPLRGRLAARPSCLHGVPGSARSLCRRRLVAAYGIPKRSVGVMTGSNETPVDKGDRPPLNSMLLIALILGLLLLLLWLNPPPAP